MAPLSRLEIDIQHKLFPSVGEAPAHAALRNLRMNLRGSEFVCVLGPSGCGKTTLLNCIAGLDRNYDGRITLPSVHGRAQPAIGYVFQNPRLLPWRTVIENIELVLDSADSDRSQVEGLLAVTGLEPFRHTYPSRLSLGLERRVALVRAFAIEPDVLLMDEPFVSLDEPTAQRLRSLLLRVWQDRPTTVVFVTHDLREAIQLADRLLLLSPAPGNVLADIAIDIARDRRSDPAAVEAFRTRLIRDNPLFHRDF